MQTSRTGSSDADAEGDAPPERGTPECLDAGGALFDAVLRQGIERSVQGFVTALSDGTLIGPFPAMQRFPDLGRPLWDVFLALAEHAQLLPVVREVVILTVGAHTGPATSATRTRSAPLGLGLTESKVRALVARQRPADLTDA